MKYIGINTKDHIKRLILYVNKIKIQYIVIKRCYHCELIKDNCEKMIGFASRIGKTKISQNIIKEIDTIEKIRDPFDIPVWFE